MNCLKCDKRAQCDIYIYQKAKLDGKKMSKVDWESWLKRKCGLEEHVDE